MRVYTITEGAGNEGWRVVGGTWEGTAREGDPTGGAEGAVWSYSWHRAPAGTAAPTHYTAGSTIGRY